MENLTGIWKGEYSFNHGSETEPQIELIPFTLTLSEADGVLKGTCTEKVGKANIQGFIEEDFISFIKNYKEQDIDEEDQKFEEKNNPDITFSGNYNPGTKSFEGVWELILDEEKIGITEDYVLELQTGNWSMKKA